MDNQKKNEINSCLLVEQSLWNYLNISEPVFSNAYEYLDAIISELRRETTRADMWMEPGTCNTGRKSNTIVVVTPRLRNLRSDILGIVQLNDHEDFPVNIISYLDNSATISVTKKHLHAATMEILTRSLVRRSIEKWYWQSIRAQKNETKNSR